MEIELRETGLLRPLDELSATAVAECRLRVADALVGMLAGSLAADLDELRALAGPADSSQPSRAVHPKLGTMDLGSAAFLNSVLLRETDWMDSYRRAGRIQSGHPSDQMAVVLALCSHPRMTGRILLELTHLAYQLWRAWSDAMPDITADGWDHVSKLSLTVPVLAAIVDDAPASRIDDAVMLSASNGGVLFGVRRGQISNWKSGLSGYALARAVWCYRLSVHFGLGPAILSDSQGNWGHAVTAISGPLAGCDPDEVFRDMEVKEFPCYQYGQAAVRCASVLHERLHERLGDHLDAVEELAILLPERDLPQVRSLLHVERPLEASAADHNVVYGVGTALRHGFLGPAHYRREHLDDAAVARLMDLATVGSLAPDDAERAAHVRLRVGQEVHEHAVLVEETGTGHLPPTERVTARRALVADKIDRLAGVCDVEATRLLDLVDGLDDLSGAEILDQVQAVFAAT